MDVIVCGLMALLASVPILVFIHHNQDSKKIERFFYHHDHQMYVLLQICIFVLSVSIMINIRAVFMHYVTAFLQRWMQFVKLSAFKLSN